jgi:hypothetical protein
MPRTAAYLDPIVAKTNFYIASVQPDIIGNRKPQGKEPADFREVNYASDRSIIPAILMLLPKRPEGTRSILLLARRLQGLSSIIFSSSGLRQIDHELQAAGSPNAWEMVIEAEIQGETILRVWPVATRTIPANYWN